jgi:hypothetical protein
MIHLHMLSVLCCTALAALAVLGVAGTATARQSEAPPTISPGWADEPSVSSALERRGIVHAGRRRPVDLASCLGVHRYGVRVVSFSEHFHRFRCRLWARNGQRYVAWVRIAKSSALTFWWVAYRTRTA